MNNEQLHQQQITPPVTEQPVQITGETPQVMPQMPADVAPFVTVDNPGDIVENLEPHVAPFVQHSGETTPVIEAVDPVQQLKQLEEEDRKNNSLTHVLVTAFKSPFTDPFNKNQEAKNWELAENRHRITEMRKRLTAQMQKDQAQDNVEQFPSQNTRSASEEPAESTSNNVTQFPTQNTQTEEGGLEHAA